MGANTWTAEQWRAYNRQTGDRHVARRLPPLSRYQVLQEDLEQEAHLARLERRRGGTRDFERRERAWIARTVSDAEAA